MFTKCKNCEFNVRRNDQVCLNCGTSNPSQSSLFSEKDAFPRRLMLLMATGLTAVVVIIFAVIKSSQREPFSPANYIPVILLAFPLSLAFSIIISGFLNTKVSGAAKRKRQSAENQKTLCQAEDRIYEQRVLFSEDTQTLEELLDEIEDDQSAEYQRLLSKLDLVNSEISLCDWQLDEIKLLRLKNATLPYQKGINQLSLEDLDEALSVTEKTLDELKELEVDDDDPDKESTEYQPILDDEKAFFARFTEARKTCETVREVLLRREKSLRQGVSPIRETFGYLPNSTDEMSPAESLDASKLLTDFSKSFEILRRKHKSLETNAENSEK